MLDFRDCGLLAPLSLRSNLMNGCALALALIAIASARDARAQAFQATPSVASGSVAFNRSTPGVETITTSSSTAIVDWAPSDTTGSGTINILPSGNIAQFNSSAAIGAGYTILNRIVPSDTSRSISFNGIVEAFEGGTSTPGGSLWFSSPGGIIVGATGQFNVGNLLLTTNSVLVGTGGELFGSSGQIQLRAGSNPSSAVTIMPGASITAPQAGSYIAIASPVVSQGGSINVNGSAALVAAESLDLTINAGLFDISVQSGSGAGGTILTHSGTTTGPASTGASDPHRIYLIAITRAAATSLLVSGTLGYQAASSASVENGAVILSAGKGISSGATPASTGNIGNAGSVSVSNATITAPLSIFASADASLSASGTVPLAQIDAPSSITIDTTGVTGTAALSSNGNIAVTGGALSLGDISAGNNFSITASGDFSAGTISAVRDASVNGQGKVTITNGTAGDDFIVKSNSTDIGSLSSTNTGGLDSEGDGSNVEVSTTGLLKLASASGHTNVVLDSTSGTGAIDAGTLTTASGNISVTSASGALSVTSTDAAGDTALKTTGADITAGVQTAGRAITVEGASLLLSDINAGSNVSLKASGNVTATKIAATRDLTVTANGAFVVDTATAGDDVVVNAGSLDAQSLASTNTGGLDSEGDGSNVQVKTTGLLKLASADGYTNIVLDTTGGTGGISAGTLTTTTGDISATTASGALSVTSIDAAGNTTLKTTGADITIGNQTAGGAISIDGAALSLGDIDAANNVSLKATGGMTATTIKAARDLTIAAGGSVVLNTATAGDDVVVSAAMLDAQGLTTTNTGGLDSEGDGSNIKVSTTSTLKLTAANGYTNVVLDTTTGTGAVEAGTLSTTTGSIGITTASGALSVTSTSAAGDITLKTTGANITAGGQNAAGAISVDGAGLALGDMNAGTNISLKASGDLNATKITAARDLTIATHGAVVFNSATAGDDAVVNAVTLDGQSLTTTNTGGLDSEGDGSNVNVSTTGLLEVASVNGYTNVVLTTANGTGAIQAGVLTTMTGDITATTNSGALSVTNSKAANNTTFTASSGDVTGGTQTAGGAIGVNGANLSLGDINAGTNVLLSASKDLTTGAIAAARDATVNGQGKVTITSGTAGDDFIVTAVSTDIGSLSSTNTGGLDSEGDGSNVKVTTTGLLKLASASGHTNVDLSATGVSGSISVGTLKTDTGAVGAITESGALSVSGINAAGDIVLKTSGGDITAGGQTAGGAISVDGAKISLGDISAGNNVILTASGDLGSTTINATRDLTIMAAGAATVGAATAGDDAMVKAGTLDAQSLASTNTGGLDSEGDGSNVEVSTTGLLKLASASGYTNVMLSSASGTGAIEAGSLTTATGNIGVTTASGALSVASTSAARGITLKTSGGDITAGGQTAGGAIDVDGAKLTLGDMSAGNNVTLTASGDLNSTNINATRDLTISAQGAATLGKATAGDDAIVKAGTLDAQSLASTNTGGLDSEGDGSNVEVSTTGLLKLANASAVTRINLASQSGTVDALDLASDIPVAASGTDVTLSSTGTLLLSSATASGALTVSSTPRIRIMGETQGQAVDFSSDDITIDPAATLVGTSVTLNSTNAVGIIIGGDDSGPGYVLSNAEFSRIHASSIAIVARGGISAMPSLLIRDLDVVGSSAGGGSAAATSGNISGANASLSFSTSGTLNVAGALKLTGAGANDRLDLIADKQLTVTTPGGSIGITDSSNALAGTLSLESAEVIVGSNQAITDLATSSSIIDRNNRLAMNDGSIVPEGYLSTGALAFQVSQGVYIQNSGGTTTDSRAGFTAGTGGVSIAALDANPIEIVINGRVARADGSFDTGAAIIPRLTLITGTMPTPYDANSTANGCLIAASGCQSPSPTPTPTPTPTPSPTPTPMPADFEEVVVDSQNNNLKTENPTLLDPSMQYQSEREAPLINFPPEIDQSQSIDEPVTGVGNDDLWRNPDRRKPVPPNP